MPTIKIPVRPKIKAAWEPRSDEPLQFSDSPAPYVNDDENSGWSTRNPVEEDDKVEVDQLELHVVRIVIICGGVHKHSFLLVSSKITNSGPLPTKNKDDVVMVMFCSTASQV
ncbi:hypothetical protein BDR07DRAFT_1398388 [Suillus spraguei]|nr:hypothetical protein BDR07DRAFT_1398388 [Suillus spraguei]